MYVARKMEELGEDWLGGPVTQDIARKMNDAVQDTPTPDQLKEDCDMEMVLIYLETGEPPVTFKTYDEVVADCSSRTSRGLLPGLLIHHCSNHFKYLANMSELYKHEYLILKNQSV